MKLYALVTKQGTACPETCLCKDCLKDSVNKERAAKNAWQDITDLELWHEATGNDACLCIVCGQKGIEVEV